MGALKPWHIIVLAAVLVLLFGARRLPNAARSIGQTMRILKTETRGLRDDDAAAAQPWRAAGPVTAQHSDERPVSGTARP